MHRSTRPNVLRSFISLFLLLLPHHFSPLVLVHANDGALDLDMVNPPIDTKPPAYSDGIPTINSESIDPNDLEIAQRTLDFPEDQENVETLTQLDTNSTVLQTVNQTQLAKNVTEVKIRCVLKVLPEGETPAVHLVNSSALVKALIPVPNVTSGECAVVMFYSPYCAFSAKAAPHYNAMPRIFPHLSFYALDAITYFSLNMRYGLVAVPTVLLFHNGKASVKYNDSEPVVEKMVSFITKYTGITPQGAVSILPDNMIGPIPSVATSRRDYVLILSWIFTISFCCVWFAKSSICMRMIECIGNTWREAEAQHEHED